MFKFPILTATSHPKFHKTGNTLVSNLLSVALSHTQVRILRVAETHQPGLLPAFLKNSLEDET